LLAALVLTAVGLAGCDGSARGSGPSARPHATHPHAGPRWNTRPASVAALGDSITRGYDACALLADCPAVSWATGTRPGVRSLAERLGARHTWNYAVSGARMADLPRQAALVDRRW
jgi:hypothetical protein